MVWGKWQDREGSLWSRCAMWYKIPLDNEKTRSICSVEAFGNIVIWQMMVGQQVIRQAQVDIRMDKSGYH